jgi:hypothetical protein
MTQTQKQADRMKLDQLEMPETPEVKRIGEDFELVPHENTFLIKIKVGDHAFHANATGAEIALWKGREAMYRIFKQVYQAKTIEEVRAVIELSKLDMGKIC